MSFEVWFTLTIFILGVFAAGHLVGYHKGWTDGYWTEHPEPESPKWVPDPRYDPTRDKPEW